MPSRPRTKLRKETAEKYYLYCKTKLYKRKEKQPKVTLSLINKLNRREFYRVYKLAKKDNPALTYEDYKTQVKAQEAAELEAKLAEKK